MKRILTMCTGNSCRSQMAEGFLKEIDDDLHVRSAGTYPSEKVHPKAVQVMNEVGIDISGGKPENVDRYINGAWDYVITVCDHARESCPVFTGNVRHRLHIGFEDPAEATGSDEYILSVFRRVRDEIKRQFEIFYNKHIKHNSA